MGFWKCLKFWDTQAVIESTIETTQKNFSRARAKYPDRDCHAWLALAYSSRAGYKVTPMIAFTRTTLCSILENDAPILLAYFILLQEMPHAIGHFKESFEEMLQPVVDLIRQGWFFERWQEKNKWTATNSPFLREVVTESFDLLARELETKSVTDLWLTLSR